MSNRPFRAHRRASRPRPLTAARVVLGLSIVGFASTSAVAGAQEAIAGRFELRPFVGAYVPTANSASCCDVTCWSGRRRRTGSFHSSP
jgi:hypothetical protein